jgi:HemY protein
VTGRLDAFQWQTPLAALPSDKTVTVESAAFKDAMLAPPRVDRPHVAEPEPALATQDNSPTTAAPTVDAAAVAPPATVEPVAPSPAATPSAAAVPAPAPVEAPAAPPPTEPVAPTAPPALFRTRPDFAKTAPSTPPIILPIVRAPDDPGIDEDRLGDEYTDRIGPELGQTGGWRGFLARWGG